MDKILNTEDVVLAEGGLDDLVVGEGDALLVDLSVSTLVDQLADGFEVGLAVCDVRLNEAEHLLGSTGDLDEDTVVDLEETEELHDLAGLGCNLVDTTRNVRGSPGEVAVHETHPRIRTTKYTLGSAGT